MILELQRALRAVLAVLRDPAVGRAADELEGVGLPARSRVAEVWSQSFFKAPRTAASCEAATFAASAVWRVYVSRE